MLSANLSEERKLTLSYVHLGLRPKPAPKTKQRNDKVEPSPQETPKTNTKRKRMIRRAEEALTKAERPKTTPKGANEY